MAEFIVTQRQTGEQVWIVEARTQREAIARVMDGEAEAVSFEIVAGGAYRAERSRTPEPHVSGEADR